MKRDKIDIIETTCFNSLCVCDSPTFSTQYVQAKFIISFNTQMLEMSIFKLHCHVNDMSNFITVSL